MCNAFSNAITVLYCACLNPNQLYQINYSKRILGDCGADRASASSAAFDRERYAVHAIPTVETNG